MKNSRPDRIARAIPGGSTLVDALGAGRLSLRGRWLFADRAARRWLRLPAGRQAFPDTLARWPAEAAASLQRAVADSRVQRRPLSLLLCLDEQVLHLQGGWQGAALHLLVLPAPPAAAPLDFLAAASHELRTPLQALLGFATQARQGGAGLPSALHGIEQAAELLRQRVDDLLDFTRLRAGRLSLLDDEPIDLRALFDRLLSLGASLRGAKPLRFRTRLDATCPRHLRGDARRLEQLLVNLLGNAIKYTEAGTIVLRARLRAQAAERVTLRLAVADTGQGIAFNRLDRVGRPFEQVGSGAQPGSGLGLAVVQELLALFDSTLRVASVAGGGSIFWFDVTLAIDPSPPRLAPRPEPAVPAQPPRVLVVDDSEIVQLALQGSLEALGAQVQTAGDAASAWTLGQRQSFDLVLTDLQLPDRSGLHLMQGWPGTPGQPLPGFVLLSGHIPDEVRAEALRAGMRACLTKPCRTEALQSLLQSLPPPPLAPAQVGRALARSWPERRQTLLAQAPGSAALRHAVHRLRGDLALVPGAPAREALSAAAALDDDLRAGQADGGQALQRLVARVDALVQASGMG